MIKFQDLRDILLEYKKQNTQGRQAILNRFKDTITHLDTLERLEQLRQMAYAATLFKYARDLFSIEHEDYFDILFDFKGMDALFSEERFRPLAAIFEFDQKAPRMRLKCSPYEITDEQWRLFQAAQNQWLQQINKSHLFKLDEIFAVERLEEEQLYPLKIQMLGAYNNKAVDRTFVSEEGQFVFASRFGAFLLAGGGMIEVDLDHTSDKLLMKMLDEHLEEEHGLLHQTAKTYYNEIDQETFKTECRNIFRKKQDYGLRNIISQLQEMMEQSAGGSNAECLKTFIRFIDDEIKYTNDEQIQKKLHELRSELLVNLLKKTALYEQALNFIRETHERVEIEQFGDTRACGGRQVSYVFIMARQGLWEWFNEHLDITPSLERSFSDDLVGATSEGMTLLDALAQFERIKFSHLLIVFYAQYAAVEKNREVLPMIWNDEVFEKARQHLVTFAQERIDTLVLPPSAATTKPH